MLTVCPMVMLSYQGQLMGKTVVVKCAFSTSVPVKCEPECVCVCVMCVSSVTVWLSEG